MPGKHYGLQDHSVSDLYPISVVGVGDHWEVHNLETGERMEALSGIGTAKYVRPSYALAGYRYNRRNGLLEWLPAEDRQALLKKYAEERRQAEKLLMFAEGYGAFGSPRRPPKVGDFLGAVRMYVSANPDPQMAVKRGLRWQGSASGRMTMHQPPQSIPKFGWVSRVDPNDEPVTAGVPVIAFTEEATKPQPDGVTGWRVLAMHDLD